MPGEASLLAGFDFLYLPSRDVARDLGYYTDVLDGEVVFAVEAYGARVAEVKLTEGGPRLILADHLEGQAPSLVHRVESLDAAIAELEHRGMRPEAQFGIPHGPCATLVSPGGQRLAIYELTRPEADAHFAGRLDFQPSRGG
jgi:hypothetical protein